MQHRAAPILALAVSLVLAGPASAVTIPFTSDADFVANAGFVKYFGGNVRWGNAGSSGDWEYSVVDGNDIPIGAGNPRQFPWDASNPMDYLFDWDTGTGMVTLDIDHTGGNVAPSPASVGTPTLGVDPINALAIRNRANLTDQADLLSIIVNFDVGGSVDLGSLIGDGDAEWILLIDNRLAGGFDVSGSAVLGDGSGSLPQYGFKVGTAAAPEPALSLLVLAGLSGLVARRRSR